MMDSYEAFFDKYVDFMKTYQDSDDAIGMMSDYAEYMKQYADYMEKLDEVNTDDLSAAVSCILHGSAGAYHEETGRNFVKNI